nr:putative exonuclease v, mitochondrial [Quercus suber]
MASGSPLRISPSITTGDGDSDYGSEFDDDVAKELLSQVESQPLKNLVVESIEEPLLKDEHATGRCMARLAQMSPNGSQELRAQHKPKVEVEYDQRNRTAFTPTRDQRDVQPEKAPSPQPTLDTRSPLLRFRTPPKKTLSVTDLVSPAWCELQYWYNLTKYGRIRRTPAMKQGSSVHKVLEEQVHTTVPVDVETKEDRFGLRIWNIIQGLRTLRRTGMTRELEVWGLVDGEVVNGIIDEITTSCPDERMESGMLREADSGESSTDRSRKSQASVLEKDQRTLTEFLTNSPTATVLENGQRPPGASHEKPRTLYLKDIKSRQANSIPAANGGQLRPVHMQLMLYHRLLSALSANDVLAARIFQRYNVHPHCPFSDAFIAQIGTFDLGFSNPPEHDPDLTNEIILSSLQDPIDTILAYNTPDSLWTLMLSEFAATIPSGSLSNLLTAEYRAASDGTLIGRRSFAFDADTVQTYVADEMRWWKGEREAKGVELEEAYKCRLCDFAAECTWRIEKVEEGLQKARLRRETRQRSEI